MNYTKATITDLCGKGEIDLTVNGNAYYMTMTWDGHKTEFIDFKRIETATKAFTQMAHNIAASEYSWEDRLEQVKRFAELDNIK